MHRRVHQRLPDRGAGKQIAVLANQAAIGLETAQPQKPPRRPIDLLVDPARGVGDLQYLGSTVVTRIDDALDAKVAGLRVALRVPAEGQYPVERCPHLASDLDDDVAIPQVGPAAGLRIVRRIESQTPQIGTEGVQVDVGRGRVPDRTLLRQDPFEIEGRIGHRARLPTFETPASSDPAPDLSGDRTPTGPRPKSRPEAPPQPPCPALPRPGRASSLKPGRLAGRGTARYTIIGYSRLRRQLIESKATEGRDMKTWTRFGAPLAAALLAVGSALGPAHAAGVKIGYVGGISGACGGLTHSARKAMEIAQAEINAAGGVLGGPIEIVWRDSKTKPDEGAKQARDLILSEKVDLLTGVCSSSVFMAINPIAKQYGVPLVSAISGTHKATIDFGHPFVVQTQPHTLMEGKALAEYAARKGWKNIVTMGLDYEWGRTTVKVFTEELGKLNPDAKIARQLWPRIGETNLTSYITAALAEKPDLIMAVMFGSGTNSLIKQGKAYGLLQRTELLTFLSTESYMSLGRDVPDGVHGWARGPFYALTSDAAREFVAKYRAAHDGEYPNDWGVLGYDAMYIIAGALEKAGSADPAALREALGAMAFDTLRGELRMRTIDNTFNAPSFIGVTKMTDDYPFPVMTDVNVIPGDVTLPDEATVQALREAAAKG